MWNTRVSCTNISEYSHMNNAFVFEGDYYNVCLGKKNFGWLILCIECRQLLSMLDIVILYNPKHNVFFQTWKSCVFPQSVDNNDVFASNILVFVLILEYTVYNYLRGMVQFEFIYHIFQNQYAEFCFFLNYINSAVYWM